MAYEALPDLVPPILSPRTCPLHVLQAGFLSLKHVRLAVCPKWGSQDIWVCGLLVFISFRRFSAIISLLSFQGSNYIHVRPLQRFPCLTLFSIYSTLFCSLLWVFSFVLFSSLLKLSPVTVNLLLNPSDEICFYFFSFTF